MTKGALGDREQGPTRFAELNAVLAELVEVSQRELADNLVGVYLQGSFALGAADLASDCDFIIVTSGPLTPTQERKTRTFHDELPTREGFWNRHIEGSYAPVDELKTLTGLGRDWLYIDHGWREMQWSEHCNSAVARWILREHGVALAGPSADRLVDAIPPGVMRDDMHREIPTFISDLLGWISIDIAWAQRYTVESLCRMWFTFEMDQVISKPDSIAWALTRLDIHWHPLLQNALDDRLLGFDPTQKAAEHLVEGTLEFAKLVTQAVL
jgi:predicted nucleotidyltransferase